MKRIAVILAISLLVTACASSRKLQRTNIKAAEQTAAVQTTDATQVSAMETTVQTTAETVQTSQLSEDEQIVTITTEFDTSLPVDSITGTPPVKSRKMQTRSRTAQQHSNQTVQLNTSVKEDAQQTTAVEQTTTTNTSVATDVQKVDDIRKGLNWVQKTLCIIGASALLYLLIRLFIKIKTRF